MSDGMTQSMPRRYCPQCAQERYSFPCYDQCESREVPVYEWELAPALAQQLADKRAAFLSPSGSAQSQG